MLEMPWSCCVLEKQGDALLDITYEEDLCKNIGLENENSSLEI